LAAFIPSPLLARGLYPAEWAGGSGEPPGTGEECAFASPPYACWKLRRAVAMANAVVGAIRLEKHPDLHLLYEQERERPTGPSQLGPCVKRWIA
jgi:hypothetical protein